MNTYFYAACRVVLLVHALWMATGAAARTINFSSTLEAVNIQSQGVPLDESFTFELGTFVSGFSPGTDNSSLWISHWELAPNVSTSPYSGPRAGYTTDPVPFGGPANAFQGFVTIDTNDQIFASGMQAYFWGYNFRESDVAAEWILLTNAAWKIPTVVPGEIELMDVNWMTSDAGTYAVTGAFNPAFEPGVSMAAQSPHMTTMLVAVPEPNAALLVLAALFSFFHHRSSLPHCRESVALSL